MFVPGCQCSIDVRYRKGGERERARRGDAVFWDCDKKVKDWRERCMEER
jgi:hypothetical protein